MTQKSKSLIGGISILGLAGLICKVVGVLYRIPLAAYIGGEGIGIYSKVFPSYNLLLTISSAGIPVAISRMVAHYVTRDDPRNAKRIFGVAMPALTALGLIATILLICGSGMLSDRCGTPDARGGYLAIAPSLLFVCVMSAFRGYMQGHRIMLPTAISQLIEQVGKVGVALPMAIWGMRAGGPALGAAGALLGTSIAEGAALLYMAVKHLLSRRAFAQVAQDESAAVLSRKRIAIRLATISIPITLGACIVPLAGWIDSFMLTNLMEGGGMDTTEALVRYGLYSGMVLTLINVPTALAMAMSTNLVPAISAGMARGDKDYVSRESITGLRIAAVIGFPCAVGMSILAKPILFLFYSGSYTAEHLTIAGKLLQMSAMTIGLFTMVPGHQRHPAGLRQAAHPHVYPAGGRCVQGAAELPAGAHSRPQHPRRAHRVAGMLHGQHGAQPLLCGQVRRATLPGHGYCAAPAGSHAGHGRGRMAAVAKAVYRKLSFRRTRKANDRRDRVRGRRHCGVRCVRGAVQGRAQRGSACPPAPPRKALKGLKPSCIR